jgi:large subunit ribosomal protein L25
MEKIALEAQIKDKKASKVRKQGFIPSVLYGPSLKENLVLMFEKSNLKDIKKAYDENLIIDLKIGDKKYPSLIYDIQKDYLTGEIIHVDFYKFDETKKVNVSLPIEVIGKSPLQELGGMINKNIERLEVECSPLNIPTDIKVDISTLVEFGDNIYLKDIKLPEGVEPQIDLETPVVTILAPKEEVIEEEQKEEVVSEVAEVAETTQEAKDKKEGEETAKESGNN